MGNRSILAQFVRQLFICVALIAFTSCSGPDGERQQGDRSSVIEGSEANRAESGVVGATISGGGQVSSPNQVLLDFGVLGGGRGNRAGNLSTVGGGEGNRAEGIRATIGGGANNIASRNGAVIAGGSGNSATQSFASIGGGNVNTADGSYTTISGGVGNLASGRISTIGGGTRNQALSAYATIGGGSFNVAIGGTSTIAGGVRNQALGIGSAIGGGAGNQARGLQTAVAGGLGNLVSDNYSSVSGGRANLAGNGNEDTEDSPYASVGGGFENQAGGAYSVIPGGFGNLSLGDYSFAAGNRAQIAQTHQGTFLFADSSDFVFTSSAPDEFAVRSTGGARFVTALDDKGEPLSGVRLSPGSGTWETLSDRNAKTGIAPVIERQVLERLMRVPVMTWRYKGQSEEVMHMGPMAQDFYAAFGLGVDENYLGAVDVDGVALAAIQGLYQQLQEKEAVIVRLQSENAIQGERLNDLESRLAALEQGRGPVSGSRVGSWLLALAFVLGLGAGGRVSMPHSDIKDSNVS